MPAWMCGSIPPGMTICPAASTTRAAPIAARLPGAPIAAILPPETPISAASVEAGITAVPPETIRSNIARPPLTQPRGKACAAEFPLATPSPKVNRGLHGISRSPDLSRRHQAGRTPWLNRARIEIAGKTLPGVANLPAQRMRRAVERQRMGGDEGAIGVDQRRRIRDRAEGIPSGAPDAPHLGKA